MGTPAARSAGRTGAVCENAPRDAAEAMAIARRVLISYVESISDSTSQYSNRGARSGRRATSHGP